LSNLRRNNQNDNLPDYIAPGLIEEVERRVSANNNNDDSEFSLSYFSNAERVRVQERIIRGRDARRQPREQERRMTEFEEMAALERARGLVLSVDRSYELEQWELEEESDDDDDDVANSEDYEQFLQLDEDVINPVSPQLVEQLPTSEFTEANA